MSEDEGQDPGPSEALAESAKPVALHGLMAVESPVLGLPACLPRLPLSEMNKLGVEQQLLWVPQFCFPALTSPISA